METADSTVDFDKTVGAVSMSPPAPCSLPPWADRITFRSGADEEIILRVPMRDADGQCRAVNHILTMRHARKLAIELAEAFLDRTVRQRERMDAANVTAETPAASAGKDG